MRFFWLLENAASGKPEKQRTLSKLFLELSNSLSFQQVLIEAQVCVTGTGSTKKNDISYLP